LIRTARLWRSLGHHDHEGNFHISGVTGPDEYSALVNDNVYTNLMAERNLRVAAELAGTLTHQARALGVDDEEIAAWRDAAAAMYVPYDERLQIHPQAEGFTQLAVLDTTDLEFPLLLHVPYFRLYSTQVVKQADLVLALYLRGDRFTPEEKARDFAYYEAITVRDSSLSACAQAVMAAEVGHVELAYDYFGEAARMDLGDLMQNTRDGLHIASLAGSWIAAVSGFGGMRDHHGVLSFNPRLPRAITRLTFRVRYRGRSLKVDVVPGEVTYQLLDGEPLTIIHGEEELVVDGGVTRTWELPVIGPEPTQPPGREPRRRRPG
jgi:alpha,alpha-trehalose phosphorylase